MPAPVVMPALRHRRRAGRPSGRLAPLPGASERGGTLLIVTFMLIPLMIITALVVDIGYAKVQRRAIQATADAAALAAAYELRDSGELEPAIRAAKDWAAKNFAGMTDEAWVGCGDAGALGDGHDSANDNRCISFELGDDLHKVRVRIPDSVQPQFFSQVGDAGLVRVSAVAEAGFVMGRSASNGDCGLCTRDWIQWSGVQDIQILGGGTIHTRTMTANWNTSLSTISPCPVKAVASANNPPNARCPGTLAHPIDFVSELPPDPFADRDPPPTGIPPCRVNGQACNVNRGNAASLLKPDRVFTQSVDLSRIELDLEPGNYYFAEGLKLNGDVKLTGTDVTLFFVCAQSNQPSRPCPANQRGGSIEAQNNNNHIDISAPATGPYADMAIYFDRNNSQGTAPKLSGNNSTYTFHGSIYAYSGKFTGNGNRLVEVYGQIYTQWWEDNGGGRTRIHYAGASENTDGGAGGAISLVR